jgi:SET domain-containing protein
MASNTITRMDERSAEQDTSRSAARGLTPRDRLLSMLADDTWVMLQPSPVAGVGVFAIRDIPKGCRSMFSEPDTPDDWVSMSRAEVDALPEHARHQVENYCLYDDEQYFVPAGGFKKMDLSLFLNHSDTPNVRSVEDGAWFEAMRDISAGEELFVDYGEIVDDEPRRALETD